MVGKSRMKMNHYSLKNIVEEEPSNALKEVKIKNNLRSESGRTLFSSPMEMLENLNEDDSLVVKS